jgi:copper chaperone CopZ
MLLKKLFLIVVLAFTIPVFVNAQVSVPSQNSPTKKAEFKVKTYFHCENGKKLIEDQLSKREDIYSVNADLETKIVTIVYNPERYKETDLIYLIHKVGYLTEKSPKDTKIEKACSHDHEGDKH